MDSTLAKDRPPSRWHPVYERYVLAEHYRFGKAYLAPYFFDALTAYAQELSRLRVPHTAEAVAALKTLRSEVLPQFDGSAEDYFFAIYQAVQRARGPEVAGAMRQGLSRNDMDLTVFRAYARDRLLEVLDSLRGLRRALLELAERHLDTLMVAYTHYRPAQPTTLGHYLMAVESLLARDHKRLFAAMKTTDASPLGSSALAGNPFPVDRVRLAQDLGFGAVMENTYDGISAGDWALEITAGLASLATSLSRLSHDLLFWAERGGFVVGDALVQGSSIMPQKRNPVVLEHVRAYVSQVLSGPITLQALNHNTPFGDLNDHSTAVLEPLERLTHAAGGALELMSVTLSESTFVPEALAAGLKDGSVMASELVDVLVTEGYLPLAEAQTRVKALMAALADTGRTLGQAEPPDFVLHLGFDDAALFRALEPRRFLERRKVLGGVAPEAQRAALEAAKKRLYNHRRALVRKRRLVRATRARLAKE